MLCSQAPVFSVLILCYNNSQYAKDVLDSVLTQDYSAIEIVFADDHSKTFDTQTIEEYILAHKKENLKQFVVYQNPRNLGTVKNINTARGHSHGTYLKFLAADDALHDASVLSQAKQALDESPAGVITSRVIKCDSELRKIGILNNTFQSRMNELTTQECYRRLCVHNDMVAPGAFFTKAFFDKWGDFDENYCLLEDWPTWLKVFRKGERIIYSDFSAVNYRSDVGCATGISKPYLADKMRAYELEIKPYFKQIGIFTVLKSRLTLGLRNSIFVRKLYAIVFRRNNT